MLGPGDRYASSPTATKISPESTKLRQRYISIPLVGDIRAAGNDDARLEQTIAPRMKGTVATNPKINVEIAAYAPYFVFGEVKNAGEYSYHLGLTVADAIAAAGGLTYRANENGSSCGTPAHRTTMTLGHSRSAFSRR